MKLFDEVIAAMRALLPGTPDKSCAFDPTLCAPPGDKNAILFRNDTAFELGGSGKTSVNSTLFGAVPDKRDAVELYGKDLCTLTQDTAFSHLTLVQLKDESEEALRYEKLQDIGFCQFQLYPKGYHIRISPAAGKEQVRVAKAALQQSPPLSLLNVGCSLIALLKAQPDVAAVKTVFITDPAVDHAALAALARKAKQITEAVQHTLEMNSLDCASCKMKPICDEVDGLRALHFKKEEERKSHGT